MNVQVCGDVHGQFHNLLKLLDTSRHVPSSNHIFMGDFVDRGCNSLEAFTLLMLLRARHSSHMTLPKGNHETGQIMQVIFVFNLISNIWCLKQEECQNLVHVKTYYSWKSWIKIDRLVNCNVWCCLLKIKPWWDSNSVHVCGQVNDYCNCVMW